MSHENNFDGLLVAFVSHQPDDAFCSKSRGKRRSFLREVASCLPSRDENRVAFDFTAPLFFARSGDGPIAVP